MLQVVNCLYLYGKFSHPQTFFFFFENGHHTLMYVLCLCTPGGRNSRLYFWFKSIICLIKFDNLFGNIVVLGKAVVYLYTW